MTEGCPLFPQNVFRLPDCSQEATERTMVCLPMRMLVGMTAMACTIAMAVGAPRVTTAPAPAGFDCKTRHLAMEFGELNSTTPSPMLWPTHAAWVYQWCQFILSVCHAISLPVSLCVVHDEGVHIDNRLRVAPLSAHQSLCGHHTPPMAEVGLHAHTHIATS
jgi:hypothetical protein